jgi:hypothetical protein
MALTVTVSRGFTVVAGVPLSDEDLNALGTPTITLSGGVGGADIADDAISATHLGANVVNGLSAVTSLAVGDKVLVFDLSASDNAAITVANLINGVFSLAATAATTFTSYTADKVTFHNGTQAVTMTPAILAEQLVAQAPAITATEGTDEVLLRDNSAADGSQAVRVSLDNLLPAVGTANSYTGVVGLTTDAKGRVTAVNTSGTGARYSGSPVALPSAAGTANAIEVDTNLGAAPGIVCAWLRCTNAGGDAGWAQNDEIALDAPKWDTGGSDYNLPYIVQRNGEIIRIIQPAGSCKVPRKDTGVEDTFTASRWNVIVNAIL